MGRGGLAFFGGRGVQRTRAGWLCQACENGAKSVILSAGLDSAAGGFTLRASGEALPASFSAKTHKEPNSMEGRTRAAFPGASG